MTRARDGGYRIVELDADGKPTGSDFIYESLEDALRHAALGYGYPAGTLLWKEVPGA